MGVVTKRMVPELKTSNAHAYVLADEPSFPSWTYGPRSLQIHVMTYKLRDVDDKLLIKDSFAKFMYIQFRSCFNNEIGYKTKKYSNIFFD